MFYTDSELEHALVHEGVQKIAWMLESRCIAPHYYDYLEDVIDSFDVVLTHDRALQGRFPRKCIFYPHGNCVIRRRDFALYEKTRLVSFISSMKLMNAPGHRMRRQFYDLYTNKGRNWTSTRLRDTRVDLYGKLANNYLEYKLDCLKDYMFHIAVENCVADTYFTEKIIDCFVTGTIPIYFGTKRILDFFDPDGILWFSSITELFQLLGRLTPAAYFERRQAIANNFAAAQEYIIPEDWIYRNTDVFR